MMARWPSIRHRTPIILREFRGINKLDPFSIAENYGTDVINLNSANYPAMKTRPGYTALGFAIGTRVLGLGVWKDTELHAVFNDGTWRKWDGNNWITLKSGLSTSAEWSFCNFKGSFTDFNLIAANGVDPVQRYDGSTVQTLAGAPTGLNYIDEHDNRLYGVVNGTEIHFSEISVPTNWTTIAQNDADPGTIVKEINTGKKIIGLKAGAGHVTVFFPNSSHELYGTSASDFRFVEVANDIGCINNASAVNLDGLMYFVGDGGIYMYSGGARPSKNFSKPVQWFIDNINQSAKQLSCIGTDGRKLYVSIPVGGDTTPKTVLEYDPQNGTWTVLSGFFTPVRFARMMSSWYSGDDIGRVLRMGQGTTDNGEPIYWRWVSKPFTSDSMAQVIRWIRALVTASIPTGSNMNVYISKKVQGDDDWQLVKAITAENEVKSAPIYIPVNIADNAKYIRIKLDGYGPVDIYEFSREQESLPLR